MKGALSQEKQEKKCSSEVGAGMLFVFSLYFIGAQEREPKNEKMGGLNLGEGE